MDIRISGIYQIVSPSGKRYIGSAVSVVRRWRDHSRMLREGKHHCKALQRASNKYGHDAFSFELVERCAVPDLIAREQHHIDQHPIGLYNSSRTAGSTLGVKKSAEEIANMRARNIGKVIPPEVRAKISKTSRGHKKSEETKARMRIAFKGHNRLTPEARAKMSATQSRLRNTSGYPNLIKSGATWQAKAPGNIYIGTYKTVEEALAAQAAYIADPTAKVRPEVSVVNTSGFKYVQFHKQRQRWVFTYKGKHRGMFATKEEAVEARDRYFDDPTAYAPNLHMKNKSGHRGVSQRGERWAATVGKKYVGYFDTIEEAVAARTAYLASVTLPATAPEPAT